MYIGSQYLYGDNASAFYATSNSINQSQLILRDSDNTVHGRLYGDTNGANFGLVDGDGEWSYLAAKDTSTSSSSSTTASR
ncbi:MAG: hypothetical protein IPL91_15985 [Hyphomicrobium sp.]|nr:hypothetical protein [Hyphomicrobium sp.]